MWRRGKPPHSLRSCSWLRGKHPTPGLAAHGACRTAGLPRGTSTRRLPPGARPRRREPGVAGQDGGRALCGRAVPGECGPRGHHPRLLGRAAAPAGGRRAGAAGGQQWGSGRWPPPSGLGLGGRRALAGARHLCTRASTGPARSHAPAPGHAVCRPAAAAGARARARPRACTTWSERGPAGLSPPACAVRGRPAEPAGRCPSPLPPAAMCPAARLITPLLPQSPTPHAPRCALLLLESVGARLEQGGPEGRAAVDGHMRRLEGLLARGEPRRLAVPGSLTGLFAGAWRHPRTPLRKSRPYSRSARIRGGGLRSQLRLCLPRSPTHRHRGEPDRPGGRPAQPHPAALHGLAAAAVGAGAQRCGAAQARAGCCLGRQRQRRCCRRRCRGTGHPAEPVGWPRRGWHARRALAAARLCAGAGRAASNGTRAAAAARGAHASSSSAGRQLLGLPGASWRGRVWALQPGAAAVLGAGRRHGRRRAGGC